MARKSLLATLLGVAALTVPSAFADKGGLPHDGSSGQGRPADQTQAQSNTHAKALAKGHAKTHAKAKTHTQGKALAKGHAKTQPQAQSNATPKANPHAQAGKTTICHATGSKTNPYVTITVSNNAVPAHQRHQDGRDIIAPNGPCPTAEASGQQQQQQQQQPSAAAPTTGASTSTGGPTGQSGVAGETVSGSSPPSGTAGTRGSSGSPNNVSVLGATTSGRSPSASSSPAATATRSSSSSGLPFTGTDAIIVAILGLAALLLGVTARRATTNRA